MRKLKEVTKDEFFEAYRKLTALDSPYYNQLKEIFGDNIGGSAGNYINLFFKLQDHIGDFKEKNIFEVGCGPGHFLYALEMLGANVYAVDKRNMAAVMPKNGIHFSHNNLLKIDSETKLAPQYFFPETTFDEFDAVISRLVFEFPVMTQEGTERILSSLIPLSKLQIHEQTYGASYLRDVNLGKLGYKADFERSPYLLNNELSVLERK